MKSASATISAFASVGHLPIIPLSLAGLVIVQPILSGPIVMSCLLWHMFEKHANGRFSMSMAKQVIGKVINMLSKEFGLTRHQVDVAIAKLGKDNVLSADFFVGMENAFIKGGKDYMSYFVYNRLRQYFA